MIRKPIDHFRHYLRMVLLALLAIVIAFPVLYMFSSSLFSLRDFNKLHLVPEKAMWENYAMAMGHRNFSYYLINSIGTSILSAVIRTVVVVFAAFALTHLHFKGKRLIFSALVLTLFVPQEAILYQNYRTIAAAGLLDTWTAIIAPGLFSAAQMLLIMGSFTAQGRDTYDAARIDGAGDLRYIGSVLVPLSGPAVLTILIQTLITSFNSYLWPLLVTNKPKTRTIQIGITMLGFAESGETGAQMATLALVSLPFLIVLAIAKRKIENALIRR